jgi:hypothetical protein
VASISYFDIVGRRTRLTWRDGFYVDYTYFDTGEMKSVWEQPAGSGLFAGDVRL